MRLQSKVAIVTGGSSGFGRAIAVRFASEGAQVLVADVDADHGRETIELIEKDDGVAHFFEADIATEDGAKRMVAAALDRFSTIDVLVNNAGIANPDRGETWNSPEASWDLVLRVNLKSVFLCSKATIPVLLGKESGGSIVNIASIAASRAVTGCPYAAAKGGMLSYTRTVSKELASRGVRMNCVSPGFMRTPMSLGGRQGLSIDEQEARMRWFGELAPMGRPGTVDDIASACLYLASDDALYVTGQEIKWWAPSQYRSCRWPSSWSGANGHSSKRAQRCCSSSVSSQRSRQRCPSS
jgi:NAD(P)-dependent dehydrogenase (short-subunit alcohol dehydrogenase family)